MIAWLAWWEKNKWSLAKMKLIEKFGLRRLFILSFGWKWATGAQSDQFPFNNLRKNPPMESCWKRRSKKCRNGARCFKAGPLEALLVIFGRSILILFQRSRKNMKNDTIFVRTRSSDHVEDAKMSKMTPRFVEFNFLTNHNRLKRFSQNERRADLQNVASDILFFAPGPSYDCSKSLVIALQRFFDFERP